MQRRIEEADRDWQTIHNLEDGLKIAFLHGQNLLQGLVPLGLRGRHNHLAYGHNAVLSKEHMLGPAQPDALGTKLAGDFRVTWRIRVAAHPKRTIAVSPLHQLREITAEVCFDEWGLAQDHLTRGAVKGQELVRLDDLVANAAVTRAFVDHQVPTTDDTTLS